MALQYIIEHARELCQTSRITINSWSQKQKIAFICTSSLISLGVLYKIRSTYTEYKLRSNGYRKLDPQSQAFEIFSENGWPATVCAFEIASDKLTKHDLKTLIKQLMTSFINFRSQIYKINGRYYYKEEFDPNTQNIDEYITVKQMKCDNIDTNICTAADIEESIFQQVINYLNDNKEFNVNWNTYKRAHIDGFYFHFSEIKKCVIFIRFNHSCGDGILMSTIAALIQTQLGNIKYINKYIDYTNVDDTVPLINDVLGSKMRKYSIWNRIYYYLDIPSALLNCFVYLLTRTDDMKCAFRGKYQAKSLLAVSRPIKVDKYKEIAKKHKGTVNDLFQAMVYGALKRYADKYKCPIFEDEAFDGEFTCVGVVNRRPLSIKKFAKSLQMFAKYGTNANRIATTPYKINIKKPTVAETQKSFKKIKYGPLPEIFQILIDVVMLIPGLAETLFAEMATAATVATSNLRGPVSLIPLPISQNSSNNDKECNKNDYVSWLFGMAVPGNLPVNFTLLTYNNHIRIGILTDEGSVQDPNELLKCFVDEWDEYNV